MITLNKSGASSESADALAIHTGVHCWGTDDGGSSSAAEIFCLPIHFAWVAAWTFQD